MKSPRRSKLQRRTTSVALLFVSLMLVSAGSCKRHAPPKTELCISGNDHRFQCNDPRLPDDDQDYDRPYPINYICTNSDDYKSLYNYTTTLREKLIKCEKELDKNSKQR